MFKISLQGRSGNVALPRTKLVLAEAAVLAALKGLPRRAVVASEFLNRAVAMPLELVCSYVFLIACCWVVFWRVVVGSVLSSAPFDED